MNNNDLLLRTYVYSQVLLSYVIDYVNISDSHKKAAF